MAKRSKQARAREFSPTAREEIELRDRGCIFCRMGYHKEELTTFEMQNFQIMHYIPRSQNGLGIPENGAVGCLGHHAMLDNGNKGRAAEMKDLFRGYLMGIYKNWNESDLVYSKWKGLTSR